MTDEIRTGKVEGIVEKQTIKGNPYKCYIVDGKKYNYFGDPVDVSVGDTIELTGYQEGKFWNVKTITKTTAQPEKVAQEAPKEQTSSVEDLLRQILAELKEMNNVKQ